jgi:protein-S-isoprenylcysteine O-methyltransferase Ste14
MLAAAQRSRTEQRVIDLVLSASALHWGIQTALGPGGASAVGATMVAVDFTAAALFALRTPPEAEAPLKDVALCLGSLIAGGVLLKLAPPYAEWPAWAAASFAFAGLLAIGSLLGLGRSFAVFPSRRRVVQSGPYRFVRHPIYAAETLMLLSSTAAAASAAAVVVAALAVGLLIVRIGVEERFLLSDGRYGAYAAAVRWRLLPGFW